MGVARVAPEVTLVHHELMATQRLAAKQAKSDKDKLSLNRKKPGAGPGSCGGDPPADGLLGKCVSF